MTDPMQALEARGIDVDLAAKFGLSCDGTSLVIPFVRDGQVVRRKFRTFGAEKRFWQDKSAIRCAWNEDVLRDDSLLDRPLIITEGELDALAAIQAGFPRTISVPDGAPPPGDRSKADLEAGGKFSWLDDIRPLLTKDRCPEIILAVDGDENGAALRQDLSVLLGRARCKFLTYPKRGEGRLKDLNEVLQHYGAKGVVETVTRATFLQVSGIYRMSELPALPPNVIYEVRGDLLRENMKIRLGDFSVLTGTPGFGKTTFANHVVCGVVQDYEITAAWASFEQEPQRDHRRALRSWFLGKNDWEADQNELRAADNWIERQHVFIVPKEDDDANFEWLMEKMETAAMRHAVKWFIIDPWNEIEHARRHDETETEYIGRAIRALKRFAKAFRVHVTVIAHPTKSVKDADGNYKMPTLYDISGSSNWYNKADLGIIVHRVNEDDTHVKVQKSRYHEVIGRPGEVRMNYHHSTRRFVECERIA
jgi:twinkle protein